MTAGLTDVAGNVGATSGAPGDGRRGGADGGGCDHGDCHRQRHVVERLCHQRHGADVSGTHGSLGAGETVQVSSDGGASCST